MECDSKYGTWTTKELKRELSLRGAVLKGKKKDLVERLEAYDRNNDFVGPVQQDLTETADQIPWTSEELQYPSADFVCPPVNLDSLDEYFSSGVDAVEIYSKSRKMYKTGWVSSFMWCQPTDGYTYVRCRVKSEMTKRLVYEVKVRCSSIGLITDASCECTAGAGSKAKCKHVAVVLYALEHARSTGKLVIQQTCTDLRQTWHQPRSVTTRSPVKASDIVYRSTTEDAAPPSRPAKNPEENQRIMNLVHNFQAGQRTPLILSRSTGRLANMHAYCNDHSYFGVPLAAHLARDRVEVSPAEAVELEKATRQQAACPRWRKERQGRVTASHFGEVMRMRPTTDPSNLAKRIVYPTELRVPAVQWGKVNEARIIREYELYMGVQVTRCGLMVDQSRPWLACSPDGLLEDRAIEVKGLYAKRALPVDADSADWLIAAADGSLELKQGSAYWYQVQGQLGITGRTLCHLIVFSDVDWRIVDVPIVSGYYASVMVPKLTAFFRDCMAHEVICKST